MTIDELRDKISLEDGTPQVLCLVKGHNGYREVRRAYIDVDGDLIIEVDMDVTE